MAFCAIVILGQLATILVLAVKLADESNDNDDHTPTTTVNVTWPESLTSSANSQAPIIINSGSDGTTGDQQQMPTIVINGVDHIVYQSVMPTAKPPLGDNYCQDAQVILPNVPCLTEDEVAANVGPQAGANVTLGYQGDMSVTQQPLLTPFFANGMCPVNVHWHLGTEHLSVGAYDEYGTGPALATSAEHHDEGGATIQEDSDTAHQDTTDTTTNNNGHRHLSGDVRPGYRCHYYNDVDPKFNTPYHWQHCENMVVGETYEVHWPHSAGGACSTPNQYQTPFADGVFCHANVLDLTTPGATATQIGVQAQVFVVVNDEAYYYPDLFRGMIVDGTSFGQDVAKYTGSTTGTSRDNTMCSSYTPITWHVDRQCHLISASSFDKMCADMKAQRDDMSADRQPHGARELVADALAANNHHMRTRFLRQQRE